MNQFFAKIVTKSVWIGLASWPCSSAEVDIGSDFSDHLVTPPDNVTPLGVQIVQATWIKLNQHGKLWRLMDTFMIFYCLMRKIVFALVGECKCFPSSADPPWPPAEFHFWWTFKRLKMVGSGIVILFSLCQSDVQPSFSAPGKAEAAESQTHLFSDVTRTAKDWRSKRKGFDGLRQAPGNQLQQTVDAERTLHLIGVWNSMETNAWRSSCILILMKPLFYSHWQAARPMQNMLHCKLAAPVRPLMVARSFGCETAMQVQFSGTMQANYTNSQLISHHEITRTARRKTEKKRAKDKSHFLQPGMRLLRNRHRRKNSKRGQGPIQTHDGGKPSNLAMA